MISFLQASTSLLLLRRPPCWNKRAQHARHVTCVTSLLARHVVLVVSWRVVTWRNKWTLGLTHCNASLFTVSCN